MLSSAAEASDASGRESGASAAGESRNSSSLDFITEFYRFIIEDRKAVSKLYLGEYMEADKYFATALTMAKKKDDNFWLSTIYEDIGNK